MDELLRERNTELDEDYYKILGCDENASVEQISTEFKVLARKCHPDKASSEDKAASEKMFVRIEKAKETLLDKDKRRKYDQWRRGGFNLVVSFEKWQEMQAQVHSSMHWVIPGKPVPSLPEAPRRSDTSGDSTGFPDGRNFVGGREGQDNEVPVSLEEFRKGSSLSSSLKNFRNNK